MGFDSTMCISCAAFWLSKILVMYYFKYYKYAHNVYYNLFQFQLIILIHFKWPLLLPTVPLHSYVSLYNHLLISILIIKRLQRNIKNKSSDTLKNPCGNYLVRNYYRDACSPKCWKLISFESYSSSFIFGWHVLLQN